MVPQQATHPGHRPDPPTGGRRVVLVLVLALLGVALCAGCGGDDAPTAPPPLPPPQGFWDGSRNQADTVEFGGRTRTYLMHLPVGYDHQTRLPLLLVFHGAGTNNQQMRDFTGFDAFADANGFVVVYPNADGVWRDTASGDRPDDVAFVRFLLDLLVREWAVLPEGVAATGFSAGGFLSHRLACEADLGISAIATIGATVRKTTAEICDPAMGGAGRPVRVLLMLGDEDNSVPLEGREDLLSFAESTEMWKRIDRCAGSPAVSFEPDEAASPRVRTETWSGCVEGSEVRAAVMEGLGHEWPRPETNPSGIDATRIVTEFVLAAWR